MNKDPILQYYALILTISSKNGQGTAFTRQYDRICKVLTKDQVGLGSSLDFSGFPILIGEIMQTLSKLSGGKTEIV